MTLGSVESRQLLRISLSVDSNGKLWDLASRAIDQSNQVDSGRAYEEIVRDYDGSWDLWVAAQYEKAEKRERPGS